MKVKIDKTFQVDASVDSVWELLSNPNKVVACVPGAKITETVDAENYKGTVSLKVGPVVTNFKGDIVIETLDAESHELVLKGDGMDVKGKGSASMTMTARLQPLGDAGTEVSTSMEVTAIGRLAQFGSRLMEDVSNRMFDQFVSCFEKKFQTGVPRVSFAADSESGAMSDAFLPSPNESDSAEPKPIEALPLFFSVLGRAVSRFFSRLFRRKNVDR